MRVKLKNTQLNKLKCLLTNKTGTILRLNKTFEEEWLLHELFWATRQTAKFRNAFANMSTNVKLGKAQISRIIQSGGSFGSWLANLREKRCKQILLYL